MAKWCRHCCLLPSQDANINISSWSPLMLKRAHVPCTCFFPLICPGPARIPHFQPQTEPLCPFTSCKGSSAHIPWQLNVPHLEMGLAAHFFVFCDTGEPALCRRHCDYCGNNGFWEQLVLISSNREGKRPLFFCPSAPYLDLYFNCLRSTLVLWLQPGGKGGC